MLWQPRWIAGHVLVLAVVISFVRLGFWQLDRHDQHVERNERIAERLGEPPLELLALLAEVAPTTDPLPLVASGDAPPWIGDVTAALAYRRVTVSGRWDTTNEVLLRSQVYRGQPGWHVLTPLVLDAADTDAAVIVDRGWVPQELDEPPVAEAAPQDGLVRLEGVLLPEGDPPSGALSSLAARNPTEGSLDRTFIVDVERLAPQMPYALVPAYLISTDPAATGGGDLPVPPAAPASESASHLAYAVQWFIFALIGIVGYALLLRQRLREANASREPPSI